MRPFFGEDKVSLSDIEAKFPKRSNCCEIEHSGWWFLGVWEEKYDGIDYSRLESGDESGVIIVTVLNRKIMLLIC